MAKTMKKIPLTEQIKEDVQLFEYAAPYTVEEGERLLDELYDKLESCIDKDERRILSEKIARIIGGYRI